MHGREDELQDAFSHFPETISFIENALEKPGNKVLIHCLEGKSRSSTFTLAYMMHKL